ncbi:MAG: hypothetical protein ACRD96_24135, partial [Bryobacteraceae bacterium]
ANPAVNVASFTPALAPGSVLSLFGSGLAGETLVAAAPLPTELGGSTVTYNGAALPLYFVAPGQINAQLPFDAASEGTLRVSTLSGTADAGVRLAATAPAIFPSVLLQLNGTLTTAETPVAAGDALIVYMTGLGRVDGDVSPGHATPASPLLRATAPVEVRFGSVTSDALFAGLAPGFIGVYQVNLAVPASLPTGSHPLQIVAGGAASNTVSVPVRSTR